MNKSIVVKYFTICVCALMLIPCQNAVFADTNPSAVYSITVIINNPLAVQDGAMWQLYVGDELYLNQDVWYPSGYTLTTQFAAEYEIKLKEIPGWIAPDPIRILVHDGFPQVIETVNYEPMVGAGTQDNPFLISTFSELNQIRSGLDKHYKLMSDIHVSEAEQAKGWKPIGAPYEGFPQGDFTGVLDGNGHSIIGLTCKNKSEFIENDYLSGLFYRIGENGRVHDLNLDHFLCTINGRIRFRPLEDIPDTLHYGGIAQINQGVISNCQVNGLFVTMLQAYTMKMCIGGIAAESSGLINRCSSLSVICDNNKPYACTIGGIVGHLSKEGRITECYSKTEIASIYNWELDFDAMLARFIGLYSTFDEGGEFFAKIFLNTLFDIGLQYFKRFDTNIGGVAGYSKGNIQYCNSIVNTKAFILTSVNAGGICGVQDEGASTEFCGSCGTISLNSYWGIAAGITGLLKANTSIRNSYSFCQLRSESNNPHMFEAFATSGGIAGISDGDIINCYFAGDAYAESLVQLRPAAAGGIAGSPSSRRRISGETCTFESSYWNQSSQRIQADTGNTRENNYGLTTQDMMQKTSYKNWDFEYYWDIVEGETFPYIKQEQSQSIFPDFRADIQNVQNQTSSIQSLPIEFKITFSLPVFRPSFTPDDIEFDGSFHPSYSEIIWDATGSAILRIYDIKNMESFDSVNITPALRANSVISLIGTFNLESTGSTVKIGPFQTVAMDAIANEYGSIQPGGRITKNVGDNLTLAVIPNENCFIRDIVIDGVSRGVDEQIVFENLQSGHSIQVFFSPFPAGNGTKESPFEISNFFQLNRIRDNLHAHYALVSDIDASSTKSPYNFKFMNKRWEWIPIGDHFHPFTGVLDGRNHRISDLKTSVNRSGFVVAGLFGSLSQATVKDLIMDRVEFSMESTGSTIEELEIEELEGEYFESDSIVCAGGIAGSVNCSEISNCKVTGKIDAKSTYFINSGGIVGVEENSEIEECCNGADIFSDGGEIIFNGGIAGKSVRGIIQRCKSTSDISSRVNPVLESSSFSSGISGWGQGAAITDCYTSGQISVEALGYESSANVAGIVAWIQDGTIHNCYSVADLQSESGNNRTAFISSFVESSEIKNCYYPDRPGTVNPPPGFFYYDADSTTIESVLPKTESKLKSQSTFSVWDFTTIWEIVENNSYPFFQYEPASVEVQRSIPSKIVTQNQNIQGVQLSFTIKDGRKITTVQIKEQLPDGLSFNNSGATKGETSVLANELTWTITEEFSGTAMLTYDIDIDANLTHGVKKIKGEYELDSSVFPTEGDSAICVMNPPDDLGIFDGHNDIDSDSNPIGPGYEGRVSYDPVSDTYVVIGAGSGIHGSADCFHFLWKHTPLIEPVLLKAKVKTEFLSGKQDEWANAGLMIRNLLYPSDCFALTGFRSDGTFFSQCRPISNSNTLPAEIYYPNSTPFYNDGGNTLSIEFSLNTSAVYAYYFSHDSNPYKWGNPLTVPFQLHGTLPPDINQYYPLNSDIFIGFAVTATSPESLVVGTFSDVTFLTGDTTLPIPVPVSHWSLY